MPPKLSIITPSFNQGPFLERTIRSVLDQGYPNLEYVVVDGGSTDGSVEIIKRYEDRLAWWVSEADEGQTEAINKGIELTTGKIVAYINSDDYYMPGAFEKAIAALESSGSSWVTGAAVDINEDDPKHRRMWRPVAPEQCEGLIAGRHWWVLTPWSVPQPSSFWSRELFDRFGLFRRDMHYAFDAEFMVRLALGGEQPERLPEETLSVRSVHPAQKSADMDLWRPELRRFIKVLRPELTRAERLKLTLVQVINRLRAAKKRTMQAAGDALELVPERIRPAIRHRDRGRVEGIGSPVGIESVEGGTDLESRRGS
ncbi:MAG: glycosyltransferase [Actinomycetota bacterium]|nr:glycosyltransferase [Actinomycetota bacterium]